MNTKENSLNTLKDIKNMMEQSSRFISLSGLSGVFAGICALFGAGWAYWLINHYNMSKQIMQLTGADNAPMYTSFKLQLLGVALVTFIAAFIFAFIFTYIRSKKQSIPIWGIVAKRLLLSMMIPLLVGGLFVFRLIDLNIVGLVAPASLLFYGIALFCASKYTLKEIRYLGYSEIILGVINLWCIGCGLYFWAVGFGVLHIVYGIYMWLKYERK